MPKFAYASSSEIFGEPDEAPQNEHTPMRPMTPYGVAKAFATQMVRVYREKFGLFACNLICYNHESPRRGESFVTRKITSSAARIKAGKQSNLSLGNLDGQRDWGYAPDYVKGFHSALQHSAPGDYVLATGQLHKVKDWLEISFAHLGLDWRKYVTFDPRFSRPTDATKLVGDSSTARQLLAWEPTCRSATSTAKEIGTTPPTYRLEFYGTIGRTQVALGLLKGFVVKRPVCHRCILGELRCWHVIAAGKL